MKKQSLFFRIDLILILFSMLVVFYVTSNNSEVDDPESVGICLITQDLQLIIVIDDMPVMLSNIARNQSLLETLSTGDKVLLTHDKLSETYPAKTNVYKISIIEYDCFGEISQETLSNLIGLGYIIEK